MIKVLLTILLLPFALFIAVAGVVLFLTYMVTFFGVWFLLPSFMKSKKTKLNKDGDEVITYCIGKYQGATVTLRK